MQLGPFYYLKNKQIHLHSKLQLFFHYIGWQEAGIHGLKSIGPGPGPNKIGKFRTNMDKKILRNPGPRKNLGLDQEEQSFENFEPIRAVRGSLARSEHSPSGEIPSDRIKTILFEKSFRTKRFRELDSEHFQPLTSHYSNHQRKIRFWQNGEFDKTRHFTKHFMVFHLREIHEFFLSCGH